jgi:acetyl-CoA acetyltransferase
MRYKNGIQDKAAITGIGATEFSKDSGRSELRRAVEAISSALDDHVTPFVLVQLEEFGFCKPGEAKDFVQNGNIEIGGSYPLNTNGGQLGEASTHGMNGVAEAVRQIRGASVNQVDGAEPVLVTAGTGVPTSAAILGGA